MHQFPVYMAHRLQLLLWTVHSYQNLLKRNGRIVLMSSLQALQRSTSTGNHCRNNFIRGHLLGRCANSFRIIVAPYAASLYKG
eukprot:m.327095 g.327095  ORF g.327095 m.327095 type:complete len:83 (-) comp16565_c0_seq10:4079-4327(-)